MRALIDVVAVLYRRSRRAMKRARRTHLSATLHGWRKELKTAWYQLRLVKPLAHGVAPVVASLKRLETDLGEDHNLVVLAATLRSCSEVKAMSAEVRQIDALAARMRQGLRTRAFAMGARLHRRYRTTLRPGCDVWRNRPWRRPRRREVTAEVVSRPVVGHQS